MHLRAISLPIKPRPMMPSVRPLTSRISNPVRLAQAPPARTDRSVSSRRRDSASIIATACSDTGIVPRPGLFTTATPRAVQAATSMESVPRPEDATITSLPAPASAAASMRCG